MTKRAISFSDLKILVEAALVASGARADVAAIMAESVVRTEEAGVASHGLAYVPTYCEHVRIGKVDGQAVPRLERPKPALLVADAASGFAHPAIRLGFEALIPLAREMGVAALAIRNSYNAGVLGLHTEALAAAGLVGIGFTNAPASIAPAGGTKPVIGTNPFAFAVPDGKGGVLLSIDQSASVIAKSEVMKHAREGRPIPPGWALGPDGQPTTDANVGLSGSMAPSGGHKGVGIGLMVELLAAAASGATLGIDASPFSGPNGGPPRTGQFFLAIDAATSSGGLFGERAARLAEALTAQEGVRLPGARKEQARRRHRAAGTVEVDQGLYDKVAALAGAQA
ncbi:Ldh family oxidoreductase [Ancylobacter sp. 6x-1]|uniref:Ldh family oxidoreductase n=1 Tax=Ancylobacter crimeensis TaxID=2579147 RepID=A0ABT0D8F5_9HYPH|nr:Ldh family oxidoreductase [Ancylobacter crimeensis]MCK0196245.1 Ldh family oxidoreductase [Ancylobacter crimeensis]